MPSRHSGRLMQRSMADIVQQPGRWHARTQDQIIPLAFRPNIQNTLLLTLDRPLQQARTEMLSMQRRCL